MSVLSKAVGSRIEFSMQDGAGVRHFGHGIIADHRRSSYIVRLTSDWWGSYLKGCEVIIYPGDLATVKEALTPQEKQTTIHRLKFVGKWVEIWTEEAAEDAPFHLSCKGYQLQDLVTDADLWEHVNNHGYRGMTLDWVLISSNWEPKKISFAGYLPAATPPKAPKCICAKSGMESFRCPVCNP